MKATLDRRVGLFTLLVIAVGLPAVTLRSLCIGVDCEAARASGDPRPFCDLPAGVKAGLTHGYYDGRSPDVIAVTSGDDRVRAGDALWPDPRDIRTAMPVVFSGVGFDRGVDITGTPTLDQIAPTIAASIGLERPHPEVRSGRPIPAALGAGSPALTVLMVAQGVSASDARQMRSVVDLTEKGAASFDGRPGSLPVESAAAMATIGTGALPAEHGITGTYVRDDDGALVPAWSRSAPLNVVATFGDHLDDLTSERAKIALIGSFPSDRGLIGGRWYPDHDRDEVLLQPPRAPRVADAAVSLLGSQRWGSDEVPDLVAVALRGEVDEIDEAVARIVSAGREGSRAVSFVFTSVASDTSPTIGAGSLVREHLDDPRLVESVAGAGLYLDQGAMAERQASDNEVISQMRRWDLDGSSLLLDVFSSRSIVFGRFC